MINIWCHRPSTSLGSLANELRSRGETVRLWTGFERPANCLLWGNGGGNKYVELARLAEAGVPVPAHSLDPHPGWLARTFRHKEARDLLKMSTHGDYYVEYVPTIREHRIHIIAGRCVRVQGKLPRTATPHPRFRSWRSGWKLVAGPDTTATLPPGARAIAKTAVASLGYQFGAVDLGTRTDGSPIVFEVNTQPGLEGGTVRCYADALLLEYSYTEE